MTPLEINIKIGKIKNLDFNTFKIKGDFNYTLSYGLPNYCTDISVAFELFDELNVLHCSVSKEVCSGTRYDAVIYNDPDMKDRVCETADTAPMVICLAYIKWKESQ